ncbi:MAG: hypothetical protein KH036_02690 [Clostridiales bacterium]|nr:hypothetical protein [Clostridiales bacterium]
MMRFCLSRAKTVREISPSPISAISLDAIPRAFKASGVLKFVMSEKSSRSKKRSVSIPSLVIIIYATLFVTAFLYIAVIISSERP